MKGFILPSIILLSSIIFNSCAVTTKNIYRSYYEFDSVDEASLFCASNPDKYIDGTLVSYSGSHILSITENNGKPRCVVEMLSSTPYSPQINLYVLYEEDSKSIKIYINNTLDNSIQITDTMNFCDVTDIIKSKYSNDVIDLKFNSLIWSRFPSIKNISWVRIYNK